MTNLAAAAVLLAAFAVLVREERPSGTTARVLSPPAAGEDDAAEPPIASHVSFVALEASQPAVPAVTAVDQDGMPPMAAPSTVTDDAAAAECAPESSATDPVVRSPRPPRHADIARRLGWSPVDGREAALSDWLEDASRGVAVPLDARFGPQDAAAIARDLAPVVIVEDR